MSINLRIHIIGDLKSDWYPKNAIEMFKKYSEGINNLNPTNLIDLLEFRKAKGSIDIKEVEIQYKRRTQREGKKLKITDGWDIIWTMIMLRF